MIKQERITTIPQVNSKTCLKSAGLHANKPDLRQINSEVYFTCAVNNNSNKYIMKVISYKYSSSSIYNTLYYTDYSTGKSFYKGS